MNQEELHRANIDNLTGLWKRIGADISELDNTYILHAAAAWTNRLWFDWECEPHPKDIDTLIKKAITQGAACIIPTWGRKSDPLEKGLRAQGFEVVFKQMAMVLSLREIKASIPTTTQIRSVKTGQEIKIWAEAASRFFSESISETIVQRIMGDTHVHLVMAVRNGACVGTGLTYEAHGAGGIHYIGVVPAYRRQGIAHQIMIHLIHSLQMHNCSYATLQASEMAEGLYHRLGFTRQFTISYYGHAEINAPAGSHD